MKPATLMLAAALLALFGQTAAGEEFEIKMLNKGEKGVMVFEPDFVQAQVGDTVKFLATDKGHNAETIKGMIPEGAEAVAGKANEEIVVQLTEEGVYGIRCKPHYAMGMVALIVAGEPVNLDAAKAVKAPGKAAKHFAELFAAVK